MNHPIWTVVAENLAEQLAASQGGILYPVQLLPFLPLSLTQVEGILEELSASDRVARQDVDSLRAYVFEDSLNKPPQHFAPQSCVYSNEPLEGPEFTAIRAEVRKTVENELSVMAEQEVWPAEAVWEHELVYLAQNLPSPVTTSEIAGHSRLPFKKVELRLEELNQKGALRFNPELNSWELPGLRYPKAAYDRHDRFIRQFPGAIREEFEVRLIKGLSASFAILLACLLLAVTAKLPFPILFFGGLIAAVLCFFKILKTPAKPLPEL
ncbi:hypothetical protein [Coraliomargarita parva]|uniref:hypothetical protein n=1 Tax=Coraliomargarita parva TaxID=3014050 RepID=UPI0022B4518B|nr:hypothetical protein [Coraliomargarita parva]